jgi:hypothetical protein
MVMNRIIGVAAMLMPEPIDGVEYAVELVWNLYIK